MTRYLFLVLILALLLPACGDDDSPTQPPPEQEPVEALRIDFTIERFEVLVDGDGVEGAGEFSFTVYVHSFGKSWDRQLSDGESATLEWSGNYRLPYAGKPQSVIIAFICSELDTNILGDTYADEDMKGLNRQAEETIDAGETIMNYITMGNDNCRVRLHYALAARLVVLE